VEVRKKQSGHARLAIAVKKVIDGNLTVVGHITQRIFLICSIFSVVKIIDGKNIGR